MTSLLNAVFALGLALTSASGVALAQDAPRSLTYEVRVGGQLLGTRELSVRYEVDAGEPTRVIESFTELNGSVGPARIAYQQRITAFAGRAPASFHAVINENGAPREVQARWTSFGWTVSVADRKRVRTFEAPPDRIDISTIDLMDPGTRWTLGRFADLRILSAETGEVWEGPVTPLGPSTRSIQGKDVAVEGWAWKSPEGRTEFWYNSEGFLVEYKQRILGIQVQGVLRSPPPAGPDEFPVKVSRAEVERLPL